VACTNLLGIDGDYTLAEDRRGGTGGSQLTEDVSGGDASTPSARDGQAFLDAHGGDALGPPHEDDAATVDGCVDCPPPMLTACTPGYYEGPLSGSHASSVTVVGVPFRLSGLVKFRLGEPINGVATVEDGNVSGTAAQPTPVPFTGTLTGIVACDTGVFSTQLDGSYSLVPGAPVGATGTYDGTFSSFAFTGTWAQVEAYTDPDGNHPYGGSGEWGPVRWMHE
jgi:hypothetical protein